MKYLELSELKVTDNKSPAELFLLLNESEIARQMTLIEHRMFAKIKVQSCDSIELSY
jgi:hypothetical protein